MDLAKSGPIRKVFIKGRGVEIYSDFHPSCESPLKVYQFTTLLNIWQVGTQLAKAYTACPIFFDSYVFGIAGHCH